MSCPDCNGTRAVPAGGGEDPALVDNGLVACPTCTGTTYTIRQRCTAIEETRYYVVLPQPLHTYLDEEFSNPVEVIEAAIRGEFEGAAIHVDWNENQDDPVGDFNEFDDLEPAEPRAPKPGHWDVDPAVLDDWKYEVANGDTLLGYHQWVDQREPAVEE